MSAADRLERILYILAVASKPGGARLEDVARALHVDIGTVVRDVQEITAREFYHPAGSTDAFEILLDRGRITVGPSSEFKRPARLSALEALALGLGLRALASEHDEPRRSEITEFAARLEQQLRAPEYAMRPRSSRPPDDGPVGADQGHTTAAAGARAHDPATLVFGEDDARGVLADAARDTRVCILRYVRPHEAEIEQRRIVPGRLLYSAGRWYVAARDLDRDALRTFRIDRIIGIDVQDEHAPVPDDRAVIEQFTRQGMVYVSEETASAQVRVRYSQRVARWVAEHANASLDPDGTLTLTHDVADPEWLIRHILQYGGDAVVETGPLRSVIASAANRLSA